MKTQNQHSESTEPLPCVQTPVSGSTCIYGDCVVEMKHFSDNFFQLANVDPPYFSGPEKRGFYGKKISTTNIKRVDYDKTDTWEIPSVDYFNELFRVSENQIIWGANYFTFKNVKPFKTPRRNEIDDFIKENPLGWIIWDKCNGDNTFNDYELAWSSFNEPTYIYQFMWNGMMQGLSENKGWIMQGNKKLNQKRIHPTEKPIKLYRYFLERYSKPFWKVLDTHLGSGSHRLASKDFQIQFYGIEKNKTHFENQEKRFLSLSSVLRLDFAY
jgi:site-specific DNA-methyltransferase (adenine-specific)